MEAGGCERLNKSTSKLRIDASEQKCLKKVDMKDSLQKKKCILQSSIKYADQSEDYTI